MNFAKRGFTIIELLVVVTIIGTLAGVAIVNFDRAQDQSRDTKRIADITSLKAALDLYFLDNKKYPVPSYGNARTANNTFSGACSLGGSQTEYVLGLASQYISALPRDPKETADRCYLYKSVSDTNYSDYKLIVHALEQSDCTIAKNRFPDLIDPARQCWAAGYWSSESVTKTW